MANLVLDGDRLVADDGTVLYMKSWPVLPHLARSFQ